MSETPLITSIKHLKILAGETLITNKQLLIDLLIYLRCPQELCAC